MRILMLTIAAFFLALGALAADVSEDVRTGVWTAEIHDGRMHVTILEGKRTGHEWSNVTTFELPLSRFENFAPGDTAKFRLDAPAGLLEFEGHFSNDEGAGHYRFTSHDAFVKEMAALGFSDLKESELFTFTTSDFKPEAIRRLRAMGYDPTRRQLDEIAVFHIDGDAVREYQKLGFTDLTLRELVELRVGNVDAAYVSAMASLGYRDLPAREVSEMAILGVKPDYVRALQAAGLKNLSTRELRDLRVGNITGASIAEYRAAGYDNLTVRQLSEFGIQRVTAAYIAQMRAAGYDHLEPRELIELRTFDITPEYIHQMNAIGVTDLRKIVELKSTGAADILLKKKKQ